MLPLLAEIIAENDKKSTAFLKNWANKIKKGVDICRKREYITPIETTKSWNQKFLTTLSISFYLQYMPGRRSPLLENACADCFLVVSALSRHCVMEE
jgi:hypothetical protein